jgi:hypothetical protein
MTSLWQLSLGPSDYDWIENMIKNNQYIFSYEKGRANMKEEPQINDDVIISCKSQLIGQGTIIRSFYEHNNNIYAMIQITNYTKDRPYLKGYRRNWIKL